MVKPKKHLGQHFLTNEMIAERIAKESITATDCNTVIEVGPGPGMLTKHLLPIYSSKLICVEFDKMMETELTQKVGLSAEKLIIDDFLRMDLGNFETPIAVIGNYPYNISSQIVFKILENKDAVIQFGGMFQKEVAQRICAPHGSKAYGILSVLTQVYYNLEYLFDVAPDNFYPKPKVVSGVMCAKRADKYDVNESLLKRVVKAAFNQRRKTLKNSLKAMMNTEFLSPEFAGLRPEQISIENFVKLCNQIEKEVAC